MPNEGNLIDTLCGAAGTRLGAPFLTSEGGVAISYGETFERAAAMAGVFAERGVAAGDRVLVRIDKSADAVAAYLACLHAGAVHVPLNPAFTRTELEYFTADAAPSLVVLDAKRVDHALPRADMAVMSIEDLASRADRSDASSPAPATRRGTDLAALLYTSGTTGRPKGAALTHDNLRHNARALHQIWRFTADDHLLHSLPIFHVHGLFVALHCAMLSAVPVTFLAKFDAAAVIDALPRSTVFMGVPTHYSRLLADHRLDRERVAGMRLFTSGSAPLPEARFNEFTDRTGHRICERYGMSEAGIITSNPYSGERIAGTVGFALPGVQLRVCDDRGLELPTGATGSLEVSGPHLFQSYWHRSEATTAAHRDDGWFITGDVGSLDNEGRLTLQGRSGDMIISGGENIYPKEIEVILDRATGVVESAVVGLPDPDFGEAVAAVIVIDADYHSAAIGDAVRSTLARFKHPKSVVIVDELPRNTMGKVQKSLLRSRLIDHLIPTATTDQPAHELPQRDDNDRGEQNS